MDVFFVWSDFNEKYLYGDLKCCVFALVCVVLAYRVKKYIHWDVV